MSIKLRDSWMWVLWKDERHRICKLPAPKDEAHKKWRDIWLQQTARLRDLDRLSEELLVKDRVFTCEKHFEPEDIEICK